MNTFVAQNWGNIASVAGLAVSIWVLIVAQRAKAAAEEARSAARSKSLVEDFEDVKNKIEQAGIFLKDRKWDSALLRVEEMLASCRQVLAGWRDYLPDDTVNQLRTSITIAETIATSATQGSMGQLSEEGWRQARLAQIELSGLINSILGAARRVEEKGL